ncbi:MAG: outer membrane beta-barrel protein [Saprospiraceae bacterium]
MPKISQIYTAAKAAATKNHQFMNRLLLLIFLLIMCEAVDAQRFEGVVVAGFQISDLDNSMNQNGYNIGIKGNYRFSPIWSVGTGILITQNGDYFDGFPKGLDYETINLQFVEIPIQINLKYGKTKKDFYRIQFYTGATYAYLFNEKMIINGENIANQVDLPTTAFLPHLGVTGFISPRFGLDFRSSLAIYGEWTLAIRGVFVL